MLHPHFIRRLRAVRAKLSAPATRNHCSLRPIRRVKEEPSALQASAPLEKIVRRCLLKRASARYQSISEVRLALRQALEDMSARTSGQPEQPSIAVLPFVNMSGDKEQGRDQRPPPGIPPPTLRFSLSSSPKSVPVHDIFISWPPT